MAKWSSQHNGKFPDPYSKLKLDEEKLKKKKKKKKDKNRDRDSILSQIDPNTNKVKRLEGGEKNKEQISDKKKLGGLGLVPNFSPFGEFRGISKFSVPHSSRNFDWGIGEKW